MGLDPLPPLTVARLALRDGGRTCWHCWEEEAVGVQHRCAKGMGGSRALERLSNGIVLCNAFNVAMEQDDSVAAYAVAYGYKVPRWIDPATVPVYDAHTGFWWLLDDGGGRRRVA